jgi:hypothetical protein
VHGLCGANTSHGKEGDEQRVRHSVLLLRVRLIVVLCQVKQEDTLTDTIVAALEFLVADEAKALAATVLHLRL